LAELDGVLWLLLMLGPLLFLQRRVHFEIQAVLLLIFRRLEIVYVMFSLFFLPGVLIHEVSHFIVARLFGVRTGRLSIIPNRLKDGRLQLGYVETESTDFFRDSLIGMAPLIFGGTAVTIIARFHLGFDKFGNVFADRSFSALQEAAAASLQTSDFWLWFYLLFTISSTMLPSESDRSAWRILAIVVIILVGIGILIGIGPWMLASIGPTVNTLFRALAVVFGVSILAHLILLIPVFLFRMGLSSVMGMKVN
jgi:hypothetical protein